MKKKFQMEKQKKQERSEKKKQEIEEMKRRKEQNEKKHEEVVKIINGLDVQRCVLIRGVSYDYKEETLKPLFEAFGPISQLFLVENNKGKITGTGYVLVEK